MTTIEHFMLCFVFGYCVGSSVKGVVESFLKGLEP